MDQSSRRIEAMSRQAPARAWLALVLISTLAIPAPLLKGQQLPPTVPTEAKTGLEVFILRGEGAVNVIPTLTAVTPVVEIRDELGRPVAGAEVIFRLPESGPGGRFGGGSTTFRTISNPAGQAAPNEFTMNKEAGAFLIHVTASVRDRRGTAVIHQANSMADPELKPAPKAGSRKKWYIIGALAAAGIAAGVIVATRGGDSIPTVTISSGPGAVGGPR